MAPWIVHSGNDHVYHTNAAHFVKDCNLCRNKARQQLLTPRVNICNFRISHVLGKNSWGSVCSHTALLDAPGCHPGSVLSVPEPQHLASQELTAHLGRLKHLSCVFQASGKKKVTFLLEYSPFNGNTFLPREFNWASLLNTTLMSTAENKFHKFNNGKFIQDLLPVQMSENTSRPTCG